MMTDEYSVCGNVAVGHKLLKDGDDLEKVAADIAIFALGWGRVSWRWNPMLR